MVVRSAPAPARAEPQRLVYFDAARSHEILTDVERVPDGLLFSVTEVPFGSRDAADAVVHEEVLSAPWEVALAIRDLEARLAASGVLYYRVAVDEADAAPVPFRGRSQCDYAPRAITLGPDAEGMTLAVRFNHYHTEGGGSRLQIAVPRVDLPGERYALAELRWDPADAAPGRLHLVHGRLSEGTLRHRWVDAHLALARSGYRKLVTQSDYAAAFGADWQKAWQSAWRVALGRFLDGAFEDADDEAEDDGRTKPPQEPDVDLRALLRHPRLVELRRRYVSPGEERKLVKAGEFPVRRFVRDARRGVSHERQPELSLLEAALLTEHGLRTMRVDLVRTEGRRLARMIGTHA